MPFYFFLWNEVNERHLSEHGIALDEFESVVCDPDDIQTSRSSDRLIAFGEVDGRYLACVYEVLDDSTILPVTAYEVD